MNKSPGSWKAQVPNTVRMRRDLNGGSLELDIEAYNERLRRSKEETRLFCENRIRADRFHDQLADEQVLKEVWDEH